MKKLKRYEGFINEAENPLDKDYLDNIERRARQEHRERMDRGDISINPMRNIMRLVNELQDIQRKGNNIEKLEKLAKEVIDYHYGEILGDDIELDYRIVKSREDTNDLKDMSDEMEKSPEIPSDDVDVPSDDVDVPSDDIEEDEESLQDEIDKRKLMNNIIQGAAKNTHGIIHSEIAKNGLDAIDDRLFPIMDKLIKSQEWVEWNINPNIATDIMKQHPSGATKIESNQDDDENDGEQNTEQNTEQDGEQENKPEIKVTAIAIDFIVLMHELIKGIYEALLVRGLPSDVEFVEKILSQTDTLMDEVYDLRHGQYIKRDVDAFVTNNRKVLEINNGLEFFYGAFVELPAKEFVHLFKEIIKGTDFARSKVDEIIDEVIDEVLEWEREEELRNAGINNDFDEPTQHIDNEMNDEIDYESMGISDLRRELDDALDNEDFSKTKMIAGIINKKEK